MIISAKANLIESKPLLVWLGAETFVEMDKRQTIDIVDRRLGNQVGVELEYFTSWLSGGRAK